MLVDSEPISIDVLLALIAEVGGEVSEATAYERFLGRSMATINGLLRDEFGLVVTDGHLDSMRAAIYERFRSDLKPIPGIREALARIDARRCVASSSQLERIRLSLEVTGLRDLFEPHIFSASMVSRGKPAPDLFLHVAREMGVAPENCTVIEDSPAGIAAAKEAGMRVFAFAGGSHAERAGLLAAFETMQPDLRLRRHARPARPAGRRAQRADAPAATQAGLRRRCRHRQRARRDFRRQGQAARPRRPSDRHEPAAARPCRA